jgi:hypothetical protein
VLRFLPSLALSDELIADALSVIGDAMAELAQPAAAQPAAAQN